ncbi:MAG TPA: dTMP kinase [Candidatus Baltobacteraceae bacterium]|nr:dTMP kinase [Candidatus Baltobacteraceae bacterium]
MFISFEGIEGSGKSTLMAAVAAELERRGLETVLTREPGGTPTGDAIREIVLRKGTSLTPVTEMLLMNASRAELVGHVIRPMLSEGIAVLCDRYVHSSYAYQAFGRGLPIQLVRMTCAAATGGLMPDLTFYVDISYETSHARVTHRALDRDRIEQEEAEFFERVRNGYKQLAREDSRIVELDGEQPAQQVVADALAAMERLFA